MSGLQALSCRRQDERSAKPEGHVPQGMPRKITTSDKTIPHGLSIRQPILYTLILNQILLN